MKFIIILATFTLLTSQCSPTSVTNSQQASQTQISTTQSLYLNINNASSYFRVNVQLKPSIGENTSLLTAKAEVWFSASNLNFFNLNHSGTTNINFSGTMRFNYSYFKNNSFLTSSKTINITGILYKSNGYTNRLSYSTLISEVGSNQINGVSDVSVNISNMTGTLVYR